MLIAGELARNQQKYGDRGYRYMLFEAGHVGQNLNLSCLALGLDSCNIGGVFDDELKGICKMESDTEHLLYAIALGKSAQQVKGAKRSLE